MYDKLENELKQVISTEDKNPSLLHSRLDQFQQKVENINDLIKVLKCSLMNAFSVRIEIMY